MSALLSYVHICTYFWFVMVSIQDWFVVAKRNFFFNIVNCQLHIFMKSRLWKSVHSHDDALSKFRFTLIQLVIHMYAANTIKSELNQNNTFSIHYRVRLWIKDLNAKSISKASARDSLILVSFSKFHETRLAL